MDVRRHLRAPTVVAVAGVVLASSALVAVGSAVPARATSGGDPYTVAVVTDSNPAPGVVETTIVADEATVDLGNGVTADVMTFNGTVPGPQFRLDVGDTVIVRFENDLDDEATAIHWHGIELDNASDGSPLTQNAVPPGDSFLYKFEIPRPGLYWYHPHHHASTNQIFRGLYGSIVVADPNEGALIADGVLPPAEDTRTLVLSDTTVCKQPGANDTDTYQDSLPWVGGPLLPEQPAPFPSELCDTPIDNDGDAIVDGSGDPVPLPAGAIPNIQIAGSGRVNEGQTVLTNGVNVGARAGSPGAPGALAPGASVLQVRPGQGLRLQLVNSATIRYFRLRLTDGAGNLIPLVRVGGEGGLLDDAVVEGGTPGGFDTKFGAGEILLTPADRADVVAAIPAGVSGVATLWTQDFSRTGTGFSNLPTVPVMHLEVTGPSSSYTIAAGTPLRSSVAGSEVEVLGPPTATLLDPSAFSPPKPGMVSQEIEMTITDFVLGFDGIQGIHDFPGDYTMAPRVASSRYAELGDTLELTMTNTTGAHHPLHPHGFSIQPLELTKPGGPNLTLDYPEFVDNVDIPAGYTLRFRVRLDDRPLIDGVTSGGGLGRWVFHCHIFTHATNGMTSELVVVDNPAGNEQPYVDATAPSVSAVRGETAAMTGTFSDPEGDPVTLSASTGAVTPSGDGTWSWTLTTGEATPPSQLVYVTATDSGGRRDQTAFDLVVGDPPAGGADLSVRQWDRPDPVAIGDTVAYTVVVANRGPSPASRVTLTHTLPGGVLPVRVKSKSGLCGSKGSTTTCRLGSLDVGQTSVVTIAAQPLQAGMISSTAAVSGTEPDPVPANNTDVDQTDVLAVAGAP